MRISLLTRVLCTGAAFLIGMAGLVGPSAAADPQNAPLVFPAGTACAFPLTVEISGTSKVTREFRDRQGNVVRTLVAGTGSSSTFINTASHKEFQLKANGAVMRTVYNPDGTATVTTGGHVVIFLFPTDVPAGPSTTLYVGQVVYLTDSASNFTVLRTSGRATDICALLS